MRAALLALALAAASPACAPPTYVQPTTCSSCPSPTAISSLGSGASVPEYLLMLALIIVICVAL